MYRIRIVGPPSASGYVQASVATLLRALVLVEDIATSDWPTNVALRFLESDGAFIVAAAKDNEQSVLRADAVDGNTTFVQVWHGGDTTRHALEILMQHVPQLAPLTSQQQKSNQQRKRGAPRLEQRADWEEMCAKALKFQELVASGRYNAQGAAALVGLDYKKAQRILKRMREPGQ